MSAASVRAGPKLRRVFGATARAMPRMQSAVRRGFAPTSVRLRDPFDLITRSSGPPSPQHEACPVTAICDVRWSPCPKDRVTARKRAAPCGPRRPLRGESRAAAACEVQCKDRPMQRRATIPGAALDPEEGAPRATDGRFPGVRTCPELVRAAGKCQSGRRLSRKSSLGK